MILDEIVEDKKKRLPGQSDTWNLSNVWWKTAGTAAKC